MFISVYFQLNKQTHTMLQEHWGRVCLEENLSSFILACKLYDRRQCNTVSTEMKGGNILGRSWSQYPGDLKEVARTALFQHSHYASKLVPEIMFANPLSESSTDPTLRW